jgi:hypothetical protein
MDCKDHDWHSIKAVEGGRDWEDPERGAIKALGGGHHEMLNEINCDEIRIDLLGWTSPVLERLRPLRLHEIS